MMNIRQIINTRLKGLLNKPKESIGLDIGSSSIKLIALEKKEHDIILKKFAYEVIPPQSNLEEILRQFVKRLQIADAPVNISLSGPSVVMRYALFPYMKQDDLKNAMRFEAKEYIPFPIEDVELDYAVLKDKLPDNKMLVLLCAVKKPAVKERISLLKSIGLTPHLIDVDCLCLANAFSFAFIKEDPANRLKDSKTQVFCALNIGNSFTNMVIVEDGVLKFSRDIAFAGKDITRKISEALNISYQEAENKKISVQDDTLNSAIDPAISNISYELRLSIDYYENQSGLTIDKIILSGPIAGSPAILKLLNYAVGIPIEAGDFFSGISLGEAINAPGFKSHRNSFAIALGLALRYLSR